MQIKRLRIAGFKSFVDPLDLPILAGLTGVVGPNGCGKSNLLEAMRWTMGEASARSLRGAEMDDVIFAGTATRPARNFAEVSLLVEVPAADGPVESEVVRRIERGAGSAYRLDGRDVRARDVQLLFADAASGAHSPALVSQGRIGAVIAAKPGDRRAMLEEAAGIAGLHVRRREAETRLRAAEANLARLDLLIADQTARAGQLRRQARAAERYRALSDQVRVAEARLIFARWRDAATAADAARADVAAIEGRVAQAQAAETAAAHAQAMAAGRQVDARDAALTARDAANASALALADHRRGLADVERQVRDLTESRRRLADERGREGELARAAATALEQLRATRAQLDAELTAAAHASPVLDAALTAAERRARDAEVELARIQAQRASETADARIAAAALQAAQARAARIARDATQLAAQRDATGDATLLADRDAAAARRLAAAVASERARHELAAADGAERAALDARATAERARAAAAAAFAALEAEITALIASTAPVGGDRLLDHLHAAPGWERALAAALDDAADTPLVAWTGATPAAGDPPPPPRTAALADHVEAPAALARRLGQLFVADADEGQPLAAGQRLVTRAGALRRWDGYRRDGAGAAAATRLAQANRLATLRADQPNVAAAYDAAAAGYARCDAALRAERRRAEAARAELTEAEAAMREAARAEDRAASALERRQAQRADLDARAQRVAAEGEDAAAETARAEAVIAALPDGRATAQAAAALARAADLARVSVAQARGALAAADAVAGRLREQLAAAAADARNWRARAGEAARRVADADRRETELAAAEAALAGQPAALAAVIATDERAHAALVAAAATAQVVERAAEAARAAADAAQRDAAEALAQLRESRAGALARLEAQELRRVELGRVSGERFSCPAPILPERLGFDPAAVDSPAAESATHGRLTAARESLGPVNLVAANQLAELETGAAGDAAERGDVGEAIHRLRGAIGALNREGRQRLLATFAAVDGHFRHLYGALFHGGRAHLELVDADDPLDAGLEIMAQPPGKRLQSLTLLSGGEQALTAVALIFALFLTNPAPICVLDEVDAALDDANIERFCDLLDRMARDTDTRYLIVTHNAVTMSRMHRLFGVTMVEPGVSRLVAVDLRSATTMVAA